MSRVESIASDVVALSDLVEIDERISWHRPGQRGFEPYNEYVILAGEKALLYDTGVALHGDSLVATLREVVGSRELLVFISRIEMDCIGNLARILDEWPGTQVVTANVVPINGLVHPRDRSAHPPAIHMQMGDTLAAFGFPHLLINQGPIRMLGTSWVWNEASRVLFTTDFFCGDMLRNENESVARRRQDDMDTPRDIRDTLLRKFDWLDIAVMDSLERDWNELFARVSPDTIAPIHGRVQAGRGLVERVVGDYRRALFDAKAI